MPPEVTRESMTRTLPPKSFAANSALANVPESFSERDDAEDPLVAGELFERGGEVGRRGLRALGRLVALPQEAVELGGRDVDVLAPRLSVAEAHVERDDAPARATVALRQVGRRVEDDRRRVSR